MIILVDDNDELREALVEFIVSLGHEVSAYRAAEDAMADLPRNRRRLRLLITDVVLPGRDGLSLARDLRRTLPGLPVILISGNPPPQSDWADRALAGCEMLRKPVPLRLLATKIAGARSVPA